MKTKYVANPVTQRFSEKEAKVIAKELLRIQRESAVVTPKEVVLRAANPESPLHKYFEWDNSKAAERYREWQARSLIISVYLVDADDESAQPVRAFVNLRPEEDDDGFAPEQGYVSTPSVAGRQNYETQVLDYAKQQLVRWKLKFGQYKEFFEVVRAIDSIT